MVSTPARTVSGFRRSWGMTSASPPRSRTAQSGEYPAKPGEGASGPVDVSGQPVRRIASRVIAGGDTGAFGRQGAGDGVADPARRTTDESEPALKSEVHADHLLRL